MTRIGGNLKNIKGKTQRGSTIWAEGVVYGRREGANDSPRFTKRSKIRSFVILINPYQILQLRSAPFCLFLRVGSPFPLLEELLQLRPFPWARLLPLGVSSAEALRIQSYKIRSQFAYLTIRSQSLSVAVVALNLHTRSFVFSRCSSFHRFEVIYSILFTVFDE